MSYAHGKRKVTDIGTWRSRFCRICRQPSGTEKQGQKRGQKKREKQVQKKGQVTGTCLLLDHDLKGDPGGFPGHLTIRDGRNFVQNFMQVI